MPAVPVTPHPISANPAAQNPLAALTRSERACLQAIAFYRRQTTTIGGVRIGDRIWHGRTLQSLRRKQMISGAPPALRLTTAGQLALDRLSNRIRKHAS
jgi:hypothetical protein